MSTSNQSTERKKIINNNRSLRTIKNELESLIEHEAITDDVYDSIMSLLPAESPLNASTSNRSNVNNNNNQESSTTATTMVPPAPTAVPSQAMNNLNLNAEPVLPSPVADPLPTRPEISRATALYRYNEPGDCNFEVGDHISVYQYMNHDWWLGKNMRTNQEGVFPRNYVQILSHSAQGSYANEKGGNVYQNGFPPPYQQQALVPSTQTSGPVNPYNSNVPPMQVAEQSTENKMGKGGEMGKKFGKKLGNAAIFGAGATIGGNIVNSIF